MEAGLNIEVPPEVIRGLDTLNCFIESFDSQGYWVTFWLASVSFFHNLVIGSPGPSR